MRIPRMPLTWSAALLLTFATGALADPTAAAPQALCDDSARAASSGDDGETASLLCSEALCESDWECQAVCPTARTATCVDYVCRYTYSGGGGGGSGPFCQEMLCADDWQCQCNGRQGYCDSNSICQFF
jgi:hypothetical protein